MYKMLTLLIFILIASIASGQPQHYTHAKISAAVLQQFLKEEPIECIVFMKNQADLTALKSMPGKINKGNFTFQSLTAFASLDQAELVEFLNKEQALFRPFWVINAILVKGDATLFKAIADREDVQMIMGNSQLRQSVPVAVSMDINRDLFIPWGIDSINAPAVWDLGFKGQGVVIGGEDTGYDWQHPAIKNQYRGWDGTTANHNYNWHDAIHAIDWHNTDDNPCGIDLLEPCDDYGHGTHTMGTMVGEDGDLKIGVAPQAKWIGQRNMERGWGNLAGYLESFEWFIAPTDLNNENPDPSMAPHVINNSWYCSAEEGCDPSTFSIMEEVVNNVKAAGIVVVVSAGNSGPYCNTIAFPPALFENSFTIGAVDFLFNAASFSSRGSTVTPSGLTIIKPNVAAPGVDVLSCIPGGQYASFSGTSMAGPHTAGVVALMISANPALAGEVELIESILEQTARITYSNDGCGSELPSALPNNTFGFGIIDALAAVEKALLATAVINEQGFTGIEINYAYPTSELTINVTGSETQGTIQVFELTGRMVMQSVLHPGLNTLSMQNHIAGMYLYKINFAKRNGSGKFLVHY
ncbi:MAG: S8 family serine peptidase [Chitinophagales bacterium]|nr:S8 family serine peptidase [Chitinophagales bacterium]